MAMLQFRASFGIGIGRVPNHAKVSIREFSSMVTRTRSNGFRKSALSLAVAAALATATPVFAQTLSSGITGQVTDSGGAPVAGAEVTITHVESGTTSKSTTDAGGRYSARGLRVGGPYTITITAPAGTKTEEDVFLELNTVDTIDAQLGAAEVELEEAQVSAVRVGREVFSKNNKGLGTNISGRSLDTAVTGNRSLDEIARLDPRINITDQGDAVISVAGQNGRYNSITVDGLSQTDPFGLNANGLAYTGAPVAMSTVAAYNIAATDFDTSSDSVGASINAITKSGTNEFHGSVYYLFKDADSMVGKRNGQKYGGFGTDKTWGATLGGPILKDDLFFFVSYEDQTVSKLAGVSTDAVATGRVSLDDVNQVIAIAEDLGLQPGSYGGAGASLGDKRYLAKLDWNIAPGQRASVAYQRTEENRATPYSSYARDNSVILSSNWYNVASTTDNYSAQVYSDWTDNFSTEFKVGYQKYDNTNGATIDQPEVLVELTGPNCAPNCTVYLGEDQFRHENWIKSKRINATLTGTYTAGPHVIKGGIDYLTNEIGDLFGRVLHGTYTFRGLANFASGTYSTFDKTIIPNGLTGSDVAGTWEYRQYTPFLQDTWQVNDNLSLVYGVRVVIPGADHAPPEQPVWEQNYGYPNNSTLGGSNKVIEPRLAFNYSFDTERRMQLRGGIGLFQSNPPYGWLTNPYLNNGVVGLRNYRSTNPVAQPFSPDPFNQPGLQSSDVIAGACTAAANCQIDVIDPDLKLPTAWKASLGFDTALPWWNLIGTVEYQYLRNKNAIAYVLPNIGTPKGTLPDGRQSLWVTYPNASTTQIGNGTNNGTVPEIYYRSSLLTNTDKGLSHALTVSLAKPVDRFGISGNLSFTYVHATEVNPGTSAQAWSNYRNQAMTNPNEIIASPANNDIPASIKLTLNWDHAFFGNYKSTASLFYNGRSGLPYTWVFGNDVNGDSVSNSGAVGDPAYIPLVNDPIVSYGTATQAQIDAFNAFIDGDSYLSKHRGKIATRNAARQPWVDQLDLGLQQELPGFGSGHKSILRLDIYNFLNLLNNDWGHTDRVSNSFYGNRRLATVSDVVNGQYVYNLGAAGSIPWEQYSVYDASGTAPSRVISRWAALLTFKYEF
jgi:hypothetical protein